MIEHMNPATAVAVFADLDLDSFTGLLPDTRLGDVSSAVGDSIAAGFGAGFEVPVWMTVHEIEPGVRMTAWYILSEDADEMNGLTETPIAWIQRPIVPADVADLVGTVGCHHPRRAQHLAAWPERGLCVSHSRRSGLATLLFGFVPMTADEFDDSPMVGHR